MILITGGARSGKSEFAENLTKMGRQQVFIYGDSKNYR